MDARTAACGGVLGASSLVSLIVIRSRRRSRNPKNKDYDKDEGTRNEIRDTRCGMRATRYGIS